jgi:hypothetical protein
VRNRPAIPASPPFKRHHVAGLEFVGIEFGDRATHRPARRTSVRPRRAYSIMMMVGLAFFDLNIVAVDIVSNASIMLAKLSSTTIWKYSMKLLPRTPCASHLEVAWIGTWSQI